MVASKRDLKLLGNSLDSQHLSTDPMTEMKFRSWQPGRSKFDQSTPTGFDRFDLFEFCRFRPLLQCLGLSGWALTEVMWSDTKNRSLHSFLSWKKWHALFSVSISDSSLIHLAGGCHIAIIPEVHTKKVELWNLPRTLRGELRVLCWHSDVGGRDHVWKNLKQEEEEKNIIR